MACRRRIFFACRREQSFLHVDGDNLVWHVDGNIFLHVNGDNLLWHVDGNIFLHVDGGNLFCMSTKTILFGMSTETIFFACRRRQPFWHVDGRFGMSTRRIPVTVDVGLDVVINQQTSLGGLVVSLKVFNHPSLG